MQQLVSKSVFAKQCGVTPAAVTKALRGALQPAIVGNRIDAAHESARNYLAEKTAPRPKEPVPGVDPLFQNAVDFCQSTGKWNASAVMRGLGIGYARAQRIFGLLVAAGHCVADPVAPSGPTGQAPEPAAVTETASPPRYRERAKKQTAKEQTESESCSQCGHVPLKAPDYLAEFLDWTLRDLLDEHGTSARFYDWLKATKELESVEEKRIKNAQSRGRLVSRELVEVGVIDPFNAAHVRLMTDGAKAITAAVLAKSAAGIAAVEIETYVTDVVGSFIRPVKDKVARNLASVAKLD